MSVVIDLGFRDRNGGDARLRPDGKALTGKRYKVTAARVSLAVRPCVRTQKMIRPD